MGVTPGRIRPGGSKSIGRDIRSLLRALAPRLPALRLPPAPAWRLSRARRPSIPLKAEMIHTINTPLLARASFKSFPLARRYPRCEPRLIYNQ